MRLRGSLVTGGVIAEGNSFGMSVMVVHGETRITGNGGAFLRNVFCGNVTVPSGSATLLDDYGLAPLADVPPERCEQEGGADSTTGTSRGRERLWAAWLGQHRSHEIQVSPTTIVDSSRRPRRRLLRVALRACRAVEPADERGAR